MSRKTPDWWYQIYYNVLAKMEKKYPNMSAEGIRIRAWKATNKICRKRNKVTC